MTQYGEYYEWDAEKLYESHFEIPAGNTLRRTELELYQDKDTWKERWNKTQAKIQPLPDKALAPCRIRFRLFGVHKMDKKVPDDDPYSRPLTSVRPRSS